ncbi:MAG: DNA polymerase III subunit gamma/tau [Waddliaceae bacterium]
MKIQQMANYQPLARQYRPKTFKEVLGQASIVTTLKNALASKHLAHAYLFCGSRGTGKTTLARLFAKALNCSHLTPDHEPCNQCSSCKEIASSLDVLEIDGASNRGIDDIRKINETVGYATAAGKYKIYIIDEVHMLTKEAFNALLKTLEEPPSQVKFFFATTEPHKVPTTIRSRCQRFNLNRIATNTIIEKLRHIVQDLGVNAEEEALRLIAQRAEGGLRDAESLLDQILTFHENEATADSVASALGMMPLDAIFSLDRAGKKGDLAVAFSIAERVFSEGKDVSHFLEMLAAHFRHILVVKFCGKDSPLLPFSDADREKYAETATLYRQEQCLSLLDYLVAMQQQLRYVSSERIAIEAILLHIMRSHHRIPVDILVHRLSELEHQQISPTKTPLSTTTTASMPSPPSPEPAKQLEEAKHTKKDNHGKYDTLLQFAAVELEGIIKK